MSIARVTLHEYINEEDIARTEAWYDSVRAELFPTAEQVKNLDAPIHVEYIGEYSSFSLGDIDGIFLLIDASLHAVVAYSMSRCRNHRIVNHGNGQCADGVPIAF